MNEKELPYVIGSITKIYLQEIQNKAEGGKSYFETNIELNIKEAFDNKNRSINALEYDYPRFAGDKDLINIFAIGDKVKIICTSNTGRHIEEIKKIE